MCLLVTKVSIKSFTNERPLEYLSPKCPLSATKHCHACQQSSRYILILICFLIAIEVNKLSWNNPSLLQCIQFELCKLPGCFSYGLRTRLQWIWMAAWQIDVVVKYHGSLWFQCTIYTSLSTKKSGLTSLISCYGWYINSNVHSTGMCSLLDKSHLRQLASLLGSPSSAIKALGSA